MVYCREYLHKPMGKQLSINLFKFIKAFVALYTIKTEEFRSFLWT